MIQVTVKIKHVKIPCLIFTCFALSGCNPFAFVQPDSEKMTTTGWAYNKPKDPPPPLYCYRTLGEMTCHASPIQDHDERFIGSYEDYQKAQKEWLEDFWG